MLTYIFRIELQSHEILSTYALPGEVDTAMQENLRVAPLERFPMASEFQKAKDQQTLIPANISASFLAWLLLETEDEVFGSKEWSIYDKSHHASWLGESLPMPMDKQKLSL